MHPSPSAVPVRLADPLEPVPLLAGSPDDDAVSSAIFAPLWGRTPAVWWGALLLSLAALGTFLVAVVVTIGIGVGTWGIDVPVAWAFAITSFVWWIGIGHAGTLISAILLLFQQRWRTSINRISETMTLFAVMMAGLFPLLHLGRPWFGYWLIPYPATMGLWTQFKSPLVWDVFAVSTYFTVSLLFWYVGLVPDLAALRDTGRSRIQRIACGVLALGWRGSARHWNEYRTAYLLLAGLATPLVISVHTIVSFDFAVSQLPGWHTTIFPPYFVAGAIFSGFAMVLTLLLPARRLLHLEGLVTTKHVDNMSKVLLVTGLMVAYGYVVEQFMAWYAGNPVEAFAYQLRWTGPYRGVYLVQLACNVLVPQLLWVRGLRQNPWVVWVVSVLVNVGMWSERFTIIAGSLIRTQLPSSWGAFQPTWVDWSLLAGTIGFFLALFLLFIRFLPAVSTTEVKELRRQLDVQAAGGPYVVPD
jgi:molybdopterin-containing oxidoreductase family membrane subunit